jgi:hypothetical protein
VSLTEVALRMILLGTRQPRLLPASRHTTSITAIRLHTCGRSSIVVGKPLSVCSVISTRYRWVPGSSSWC